ncbi:hypothetical protein D7Y57_03530 [Stenotrophomonas maltophilia]|uniref:ankyrin repeat domain-containing protein n=1 Tax=Stenotrophomonas maltophilia TaxID=40324 RepID=UPI0009AC5994|nr:ankyrin repeat domain-containing protein [Stenotrophomonas maltophilia]MBA0233228.1 hypothetical protein [Stenotrophomonas maltophilia]MBA0267267.1 hypothetical protein [Stenotrophomonas maltophilia]MBA0455212.1 hypothetical protein [Stenotrophomonas maltophilia]MCD5965578.1 ankyrin repeat domain-containing protein [Stenotrophomonas maltophilia]QGL75287.1 ankyrin repeat domain-containing protein [Stenotrophomonas maltophilia]
MNKLSLQDVRVLANTSRQHLITHTDEQGRTALHWAVINKRFDVADALVAYGANPLAKDKKGKTPMDFANRCVNQEQDWRLRTSVIAQYWLKMAPIEQFNVDKALLRIRERSIILAQAQERFRLRAQNLKM